MPRSLFRDTVAVRGSAGMVPLAGAAVSFATDAAGTPYTLPLYPDGTSTTPVPRPYVTGPAGELEVWADNPVRLWITATAPGYQPAREVIDLEPDPGVIYATVGYVDQALIDHEAEANPHAQYLTESEGDLRYLPATYAPDLSDYWTKAESDARYLPSTYVPDAYTKAQSDARYQGLAEKGVPNGYPSLDPAGLIPTTYLPPLAITDTFVVASEAEQLALVAETGDVCVRVDESQTYILAAEPASVLDNWVELASSSAGGMVTVLRSEEFLPAAAATTVTLEAVPTEVLHVFRNGVEQSAMQGHYSVAGQVLTFSDPFAAGEVVSVSYVIGTSVPGPSGDYLPLTGGTVTGMIAIDQGLSPGRLFQRPGVQEIGLTYNVNYTTDWELDDPSQLGILTHARPDAGVAWGVSIWDYATGWNTRPWYVATNGDTMIRDKVLGLSPDADNTLEWRSNGLYSSASGSGGGGDFLPLAGGTLTGPLVMLGATGEGDTVLMAGSSSAPTTPWFQLRGNGWMEWGPGDDSFETYFYRQAANVMRLEGHFQPDTNNWWELGSSTRRWKKLWATDADFTNAPTVGGVALPLASHNHDAAYVNVGGDTMTGTLALTPGAGVAALTTTGHVDVRVPSGSAPVQWWVAGTLRGNVDSNGTLVLAPSAGSAAVFIGTTPQPKITVASGAPSSPMTGDLWVW